MRQHFDVAIVGAGLIGLATSMKWLERFPGCRLVVLEREAEITRHQSGHNSGVIHSGIYYRPGSDKALLCGRGKTQLEAFCDENDIAWQRCGKVIVATRESELPALEMIATRGDENEVPYRRLNTDQLRQREPAAAGIAALEVPGTGIVDYRAVGTAMRTRIESMGGEIRRQAHVTAISPGDRDLTLTIQDGSQVTARSAVACAGLHADEVYEMASPSKTRSIAIIPFRGEYYALRRDRRPLCRHLIYPVPDPAFPFLGVHFTRGIDGDVHCGPNAVLALSREGYRWRDVRIGELSRTLRFDGFRKLAKAHWRMGLVEMHRSLRKSSFVAALRRLIPTVTADDLVPSPAGVRAQAVRSDGTLVDDFAFESTPHMTHVLNAPSPAATACLAIADRIVDQHAKHAAIGD